MADRSWFYASEGQQKGPVPEPQLRDFITGGIVGPDTLVWTEGMAGWQRASEIPGLMSDVSSAPPLPRSTAAATASGGTGGVPVAADLPIWPLFGHSLLYSIGFILVIPAPWTATAFYRWLVSRIQVPGRPYLAFTGQVGDIWYVFVALGLMSYAGLSDSTLVQLAILAVDSYLSWLVLRWLASNLSSNGQRLPIAFNGDALTFVGWYLLLAISVISIIGWAWVVTAWMRWNCSNISGTRREILFTASGLEMLWRTIVLVVACLCLIPIPWALRWYANWYVSQFSLVERGRAG